MISNVDLSKLYDIKDSEWLWEEPTPLASYKNMDEDELWEARREEVRNLESFQAFEWRRRSEMKENPDAKYISSRWEDIRKDSGLIRSRWVLREFANTQSEGEFFSATPDPTSIEVVHMYALMHDHDIWYIDLKRAFLHAPEFDIVWSEPPEGWNVDPDWVWQLKRKLNGRRDGSQSFSEWFGVQLQQLGMKRSVLHPCTYVVSCGGGEVATVSAHVDDGVLTGPSPFLKALQSKLEQSVMCVVNGKLAADQPVDNDNWCTFLGKVRRRVGNRLESKVKEKFVLKAAEVLDLMEANPVQSPTTAEIYHKESKEALDTTRHSHLRKVVGILQYAAPECKLAQFAL